MGKLSKAEIRLLSTLIGACTTVALSAILSGSICVMSVSFSVAVLAVCG